MASIYEIYVDNHADLTETWEDIKKDPNATDENNSSSRYWLVENQIEPTKHALGKKHWELVQLQGLKGYSLPSGTTADQANVESGTKGHFDEDKQVAEANAEMAKFGKYFFDQNEAMKKAWPTMTQEQKDAVEYDPLRENYILPSGANPYEQLVQNYPDLRQTWLDISQGKDTESARYWLGERNLIKEIDLDVVDPYNVAQRVDAGYPPSGKEQPPSGGGDDVDDDDVDDDDSGSGSGNNSIWSTTGLEGDYGQTVTKGLFGFSGEGPEASFSKHPYSYLNAYNIGQNLAYKPWHAASWRGPDKEKFYGGIPGGKDTKDQLYTYGGKTPMQVPGGWTPVQLPGGAKSAYPIARTPLYPSGATSKAGPLPTYVKKTVVDDSSDDSSDDVSDDSSTTKTGAGSGKRLAFYKGRAGALGGIDTSGKNIMFQVTGDPTERYIGDGKTTWGDMALDIWNAGKRYQTTAHRSMKTPNWTDADNLWKVDLTADMREQGGMSQFNIKFADWAGGVSSNKIYGGTPTLDFLGTPQNQMVTDPTSGRQTRVAYTLPTSYGKSYSTGGSESLAPYLSGTTPAQNWAQLAGMKSAGFPTTYGGKWVLPGIYGHSVEQDDIRTPTTNLLGYGLPQFLTDAMLDETGGDPSGINWGSMPSNSKEMM